MQYRRGCGARRRGGWLVAALLASILGAPAHADTGQMVVSAVVLTRSNCRFLTGAATLPFGTIDPSSGTTATASTTMRFWCVGFRGSTTFAVVADDGSNSPGAGLRRMRHTGTPTEYLPYNLSITPSSGTLPWLATQTITVSGTITPAQFQNAKQGGYSDTVLVSLYP